MFLRSFRKVILCRSEEMCSKSALEILEQLVHTLFLWLTYISGAVTKDDIQKCYSKCYSSPLLPVIAFAQKVYSEVLQKWNATVW